MIIDLTKNKITNETTILFLRVGMPPAKSPAKGGAPEAALLLPLVVSIAEEVGPPPRNNQPSLVYYARFNGTIV